jgi:S-adenosylmethionine-diacylglycerol 3-amino-3-carboxypropyl transferase
MKMHPIDWASGKFFNYVHQNNLIYNTCWEDPRLDRQAMDLGPDDNVLVITSAGCNALDYALDSPRRIFAVDMNPKQNALLELKIAGIKALDYDDFFSLFGRGRLADFPTIYSTKMRQYLSPQGRKHWDEQQNYFDETPRNRGFYSRGTSGAFARLCHYYLGAQELHGYISQLFNAPSLDKQKEIYYEFVHHAVWTKFLRWCMSWDATLSLLGVPRPQRKQVEQGYPGGIVKFMQDCVETVFTKLPTRDNYFWWLYFNGEYTPDRCPEYLTLSGFERLKAGLVDKISVHTSSLQGFLDTTENQISRYVLLDHMDWLAHGKSEALSAEWHSFVRRASPDARFLWRSGGLTVDFVDPITVQYRGRSRRMGDILNYKTALARELHSQDRVHTYGSFYIAHLN